MKGIESLIDLALVDQGALDQIKDVIGHRGVGDVAIMPNCYEGLVVPNGCAIQTHGAIWPAAVGCDIGCGVMHFNTKIKKSDLKKSVDEIFDGIVNNVPMGFESQDGDIIYHQQFPEDILGKHTAERIDNWANCQFGTLGSGSHFIELGTNANDEIGITIHNGSRNVGGLIYKWFKKQIGDDLIPSDSDLAKKYLKAHRWACDFANQSRYAIMNVCLLQLGIQTKEKPIVGIIDCVHNSVSSDNIFPSLVPRYIHRKGCIPAYAKSRGVIPGNMKDGVFVVAGLGNSNYMYSASNGAGRSQKSIELDDIIKFEDQMKDMRLDDNSDDIRFGGNSDDVYSYCKEAPDSYKSIWMIIHSQSGINIAVEDYFKPFISIKGVNSSHR